MKSDPNFIVSVLLIVGAINWGYLASLGSASDLGSHDIIHFVYSKFSRGVDDYVHVRHLQKIVYAAVGIAGVVHAMALYKELANKEKA